MTACTIQIERLADGCYRARCANIPGIEVVAATEADARAGCERAIEGYLRGQFEEQAHEPH